MTKVLITGGAGFIGTSLSKHLAQKGVAVRTLDLMASPIEGMENLTGSILDVNDVKRAVRGCSYVVHLAAMLGVRRTELKKLEALTINIQGTVNILEACVRERLKKIIFISSSEVYGNQNKFPIKEDARINPLSLYAVSKLAGEEYMRAYYERYGLKYSILRLFNVYGPGQVAEFVIPRFVKAAMENKPLLVYGSGEQIRAFCYVEDAVKAIALALVNSKADLEIFNVGNAQEPIKIKDLAAKVISLAGKKMKPSFISLANSDRSQTREVMKRIPDISKAKRLLGFKPQICLSAGILKVMAYGNIQETWFEPLEKR